MEDTNNILYEPNRNKKSVNKDLYIGLEINQNYSNVMDSDLQNTINTYKVFDNERNSTTKYRLTSTINPICSNVLVNPLTKVYNSNGSLLTNYQRQTAIDTINTGNTYQFGYDILDNYYYRLDTFMTGNSINDFNGIELTENVLFEDSVAGNTIEDNGWVCFLNKTKINGNRFLKTKQGCEKIDFFPTREYFNFKSNYNSMPNSVNSNWDLALTYPYDNEYNNKLVSGGYAWSINGMPIVSSITATTENGSFVQIKTPYKHGLSKGDIIKLKRGGDGSDNTYLVYDLGDVIKNDKLYIFTIDIDKYSELKNVSTISDMLNYRVCKVVNKSDCAYYLRKFRKIPNFKNETSDITEDTIEQLIINNNTPLTFDKYQPGFARNLYNDDLTQIQFSDDIDINLLKDNLGRPLSEIYLTIIKKTKTSTPNEMGGVFTDLVSGVGCNTGSTGYYPINYISGNLGVIGDNINIGNDINVTYTSTSDSNLILGTGFLGFYAQRQDNSTDTNHFSWTYKDQINLTNVDLYYGLSIKMTYAFLTDGFSVGDSVSLSVKQFGGGYVKKTEMMYSSVNEGVFRFDFNIDKTQPILFEFTNTYNYTTQKPTIIIGSIELNPIKEPEMYLEDNITITGSSIGANLFYGDIVEYSPSEVKERVLDDIYYRFNTNDRESSGNMYYHVVNNTTGSYYLTSKSIQSRLEGYYYKPHNKIPIKNYSEVISSGELTPIVVCDTFKSGVTYDYNTYSYDIRLVSGLTNNNTMYLVLKSDNVSSFIDGDVIRITKKNSSIYTNKYIRVRGDIQNSICIPYDYEFFGDVQNIDFSNYYFDKYYSPNIPLYAQDMGNGKCLWRDILPEGVFDSESTFNKEFTYTNGRLYLNKMFNFYVRRQDPFGYYKLRDINFPSDLTGESDVEVIQNNLVQKTDGTC